MRARLPAPLRAGLLLLVGGLLVGCGSGPTPPKTYPAKGTVAYKDGTVFAGGHIQFRASPDNGLTTLARIGDDGSFTLETLWNNTKVSGAPEGTYSVTITPAIGQNQSGGRTINVPGKHTVKPREENIFEFKVEKRRK